MRGIAVSFVLRLSTNDQFVTNNIMVIAAHLPCSRVLAPYDFALIPKLKIKLRATR
jgi:hypothetical protein